MRGCCCYWHDPGPCPVDDTPHTACTPESVGALTVAVARPHAVDLWLAKQSPESLTYSTKTYRRKLHRKLVRRD